MYDHIPLALQLIVPLILIIDGRTADVAIRFSRSGIVATKPPVKNTAISLASR